MIEILLFITMFFIGCGVLLYAKVNIKSTTVEYIYNFIFSKTFISFILFFIIFWIYEYNDMFFISRNKHMFFLENNKEIIVSYCIILFIIFCSYFKFKCLLDIPLFGAFILINSMKKEYILMFLITLVVINFGYVYFTKTEYKKINIIYNVILIILIILGLFL